MRRGHAVAWLLCAWVLWRSIWTAGMSDVGGVTGSHDAYESKRDCEQEREAIFSRLTAMVAPDDRLFERKGRVFEVKDRASGRAVRTETFQCLPSGTDPRPRTKG